MILLYILGLLLSLTLLLPFVIVPYEYLLYFVILVYVFIILITLYFNVKKNDSSLIKRPPSKTIVRRGVYHLFMFYTTMMLIIAGYTFLINLCEDKLIIDNIKNLSTTMMILAVGFIVFGLIINIFKWYFSKNADKIALGSRASIYAICTVLIITLIWMLFFGVDKNVAINAVKEENYLVLMVLTGTIIIIDMICLLFATILHKEPANSTNLIKMIEEEKEIAKVTTVMPSEVEKEEIKEISDAKAVEDEVIEEVDSKKEKIIQKERLRLEKEEQKKLEKIEKKVQKKQAKKAKKEEVVFEEIKEDINVEVIEEVSDEVSNEEVIIIDESIQEEN